MSENLKNLEESLPPTGLPRIVIVGGGFAGVELVSKLRGCPVETVMLDKNNYHTFIPLLYQVATAGLSPGDISNPLREFLQYDENFHFRLAKTQSIDTDRQIISTSLGDLHYDFLVLATGSVTNFFGNKELEGVSQKLREISDAIALRTHLIGNFEKALLAKDEEQQQRFMNMVIVGAGPTGVELAGAIGELRDHVLPKDYPELDFRKMKIFLLEGSGQVLNAMSEYAGKKSRKYLEKFGVEVRLDVRVEDYVDGNVVLHDGSKIPTECVIWSAGVKGNIPEGFEKDSIKAGRLHVDEFNAVHGVENVFAIGDVALQEMEGWDRGLPMLAPVAIQQAQNLGENFKRRIKKQEPKPFKYFDKGSMATIGRNRAVVDAPGFSFGGFFGWFVWMFIHLVSIMGFRRKLLVFSNWVWNYISYNRGNRLIIDLDKDRKS